VPERAPEDRVAEGPHVIAQSGRRRVRGNAVPFQGRDVDRVSQRTVDQCEGCGHGRDQPEQPGGLRPPRPTAVTFRRVRCSPFSSGCCALAEESIQQCGSLIVFGCGLRSVLGRCATYPKRPPERLRQQLQVWRCLRARRWRPRRWPGPSLGPGSGSVPPLSSCPQRLPTLSALVAGRPG
jgi:hypothetical protein